MKKLLRILLVCALLGALGLLPFHASDAARLLPVKTIVVTRSGEEYIVDIGAGVRAVGRSLTEALARLKEEVTGVVFLPTAEQIILTEPAEETAEAAAAEEAFRPAAGIYRTPDPEPDARAMGAYLSTHTSNTTVLDLRAALAVGRELRLPVIRAAEGGYRVDE